MQIFYKNFQFFWSRPSNTRAASSYYSNIK